MKTKLLFWWRKMIHFMQWINNYLERTQNGWDIANPTPPQHAPFIHRGGSKRERRGMLSFFSGIILLLTWTSWLVPQDSCCCCCYWTFDRISVLVFSLFLFEGCEKWPPVECFVGWSPCGTACWSCADRRKASPQPDAPKLTLFTALSNRSIRRSTDSRYSRTP